MGDWLISLITVAASTVVSTIIGLLIKNMVGKKIDEQKELNDLRAQRDREERKSDVVETLHSELKPIEEKVDLIDDKITVLSRGEQAGLRHDLYQIYDQWINKGYCPREVKADFDNIYQSYHTLGKNGVMDGCYTRLMALPDFEPIVKNNKLEVSSTSR